MRNRYQMVIWVVALLGCERVNVGNVGLLIHTAGAARGLQNAPIVSGWVTYNPFTEDVIEFPTVLQTVVWTGKEALSFGSVEGVNVGADVSISFRIDPALAPKFYGKFRQSDLEEFAHGFLRNQVRDGLNEIASRMPVARIYGEGKTELLHGAHKFVSDRLMPDGILVDQLNSHLSLPNNVQASINTTIAQTQQAEQARNRVAQIEAEAKQRVAQANGEAEAKRTASDADAYAMLKRAEAEAKANLLIAEAQADANRKLREAISPSLVEYEKVRRWDGKLPMIGSGASTLVDLRAFGADR